jgi:hypothetical protein
MRAACATLGKPDAAYEFVNIIANLLGLDLNAKKRKKRVRK